MPFTAVNVPVQSLTDVLARPEELPDVETFRIASYNARNLFGEAPDVHSGRPNPPTPEEQREKTTDLTDDPRWGSALGRALRDYADLLAGRPERASNAVPCLRRALMIHAFDGRPNQVGAVLRTRSRLEPTRERWDSAEEALTAAASALFKGRNVAGWAGTMTDLAALAVERDHFEQALAVVKVCRGVLQRDPDLYGKELARVALLAARAAWRLGRLDEARDWAREAVSLPGASDRIAAAHNLHDALTALGDAWKDRAP